jgi:predicted protein tyrosine phosphatase
MRRKNKNILFICYANLNRSPTAADVARMIAEQKNLNIDISSAGIAIYAENSLTKFLADSADTIFVMEDYMKKMLEEYYGQKGEKIIVLHIPDIYARNDPELVQILEKQLHHYLLG